MIEGMDLEGDEENGLVMDLPVEDGPSNTKSQQNDGNGHTISSDLEVGRIPNETSAGTYSPKPETSKPLSANEAALATLEIKLREFAAKMSSEKYKQTAVDKKDDQTDAPAEEELPQSECDSEKPPSQSQAITKVKDELPTTQPEQSSVIQSEQKITENVETCDTLKTPLQEPKNKQSIQDPLPDHNGISTNLKDTPSIQKISISTPRTVGDEKKLTQDWNSVGVKRCPVCRFTTDQEDIYRNHVTTCTPTRQSSGDGLVSLSFNGDYTCVTCEISWHLKAEFEEHLVCHLFGEPYICITCKKTFSSRMAIESHAKNDHPKGESRCGLRGVKKGRRVIEELEVKKKYKVFGRISIATTPRNQLTTSPATKDDKTDKAVTESNATNQGAGKTVAISASEPSVPKVFIISTSSVSHLTPVNAVQSIAMMTSSLVQTQTSSATTNPTTLAWKLPTALANVMGKDSHDKGTSSTIAIESKPSTGKDWADGNGVKYTLKNYEIPNLPPPPPYKPPVTKVVSASQPVGNSQPVFLIPVQYPNPLNNKVIFPTSLQQHLNNQVQFILPPNQPQMIAPAPMPGAPTTRTLQGNVPTIIASPSAIVNHTAVTGIQFASSNQTQASQKNTLISSTIQDSPLIPVSQGFNQPDPYGLTSVPTATTSVVSTSTLQQKDAIPLQASPLHSAPSHLTVRRPKGILVSQVPVLETPAFDPTKQLSITDATKSALKKFLFRIKPGSGFVCETCRKFTYDELIFRKHAWDHFHQRDSTTCRTCDPGSILKKDFMKCQLVSNITTSLIKRSASDETSNKNGSGSTPGHVITIGEDESITISDDEGEKKNDGTASKEETSTGKTETTAVIVLDDDNSDTEKNPELQIRITSAYTLQGSNEHDSFQAMVPEIQKQNSTENDENLSPLSEQSEVPVESPKVVSVGSTDSPPQNTETNGSNSPDTELQSSDTSQKVNAPVLPENQSTDTSEMQTEEVVSKANSSRSQTASPQGHQTSILKTFEELVRGGNPSTAFFICGFDQCTFTTTTSSKYREHLNSEHLGAFQYICGHCGLKSHTDDSHVRHLSSHASTKQFVLYKCGEQGCKYKTNLMKHFKSHMKIHNTFKCWYCIKTFPDSTSLTDHLLDNVLQFTSCPNCTYKHGSRNTVLQHIHLSHPEKQRMITVTSQIICRDRELNFFCLPYARLAYVPSAEFPPITDVPNLPCRDDDDDDVDVETPFEQSHFEDFGDDYQTEEPISPKINKSKTVSTVRDENEPSTSTASKTPKRQETIGSGPASLRCKDCSYLSWNVLFFKEHASLHEKDPEREKRFVCMYCPRGMHNLSKFKKHISNHIGTHVIIIFSCTLCTFTTNQKYHILDHVKDSHGSLGTFTQYTEYVKSYEFACKLCDYKSRQIEHVVGHESAVHGKSERKSSSSSPRKSIPAPLPKPSAKPVEKLKYHCQYCEEFFKHRHNLRDHMRIKHTDIENKSFVTYKCHFCHYSSTKKTRVLDHITNKHKHQKLRILRRIENVENAPENGDLAKESGNTADKQYTEEDSDVHRFHCEICDFSITSQAKLDAHISLNHSSAGKMHGKGRSEPKEEVQIPDGNIYKQPFTCPKCSFSSKIRINVMRHIKSHSELVPIRQLKVAIQFKVGSGPKKTATARKSTSKSVVKSALGFSESTSPNRFLKNPFLSVKEKVKELENKEELQQAAGKESEEYSLEDDRLHKKLSACFIPTEKESGYKCRICQQVIAKKYVLHRHILDHLGIVFHRCAYCKEGTLDQTLMSGHIHKDHPLKQVEFMSYTSHEIDEQLKNKILNQNFNDAIDIFGQSEKSVDSTKSNNGRMDVIKQKVHETFQQQESTQNESSASNDPGQEKDVYKCTECNYSAPQKYHLQQHIAYQHESKSVKKYGCSVCDHKSDYKHGIFRHLDRRHPGKPRKLLVLNGASQTESADTNHSRSATDNHDDTTLAESTEGGGTVSSEPLKTDGKDRKKTGKPSDNNAKPSFVVNSLGKKVKTDQLKVSSAGVFEMRVVYKCKECGEKRASKSGMYDHFHSSRCHRPVYQCDHCNVFSSPVKSAIFKHSKIRHLGAKPSFSELPLASKIKVIKFPVKTCVNMDSKQNAAREESPFQAPSQSSVSTKTSADDEEDDSPPDGGPKLIVCKICMNYKSSSIMRLQYHINTKHGGKPLFCLKCKYKTPLVKQIMNHCSNVHEMKSPRYTQKDKHSHFKLECMSPERPSKARASVTPERPETVHSVKQDSNLNTSATSKVEGRTSSKTYSCLKCDYVADNLRKIRGHLKSHFNYKPYVCKYCNARLQYESNLKRHITSVHSGKDLKFSVQKDDVIETKLQKLLKQIKAIAENPSVEVKKPTSVVQHKLEEEKRLGILRVGVEFECKFCQYSALHRYLVKNHILARHNANKGIKRKAQSEEDDELPPNKVLKGSPKKDVGTDINQDGSERESSVNNLSGNESESKEKSPTKFAVARDPYSGDRVYKCLSCDYNTPNKKNLKGHMVKHGSKNYKCCYCEYSSKLISNAYRHIENVHKGKTPRVLNLRRQKVMSPKRLMTGADSLARPYKSERKQESDEDTDDSMETTVTTGSVQGRSAVSAAVLNYCCNVCNTTVIGLYHFRQHLATHSQFSHLTKGADIGSRLLCGYCSYMAVSNADFSDHISTHMNERPYKCGYCEFSCYSRAKVRQHVGSYHPDNEERIINLKLGTHDVRSANQAMLVNCDPKVKLDSEVVTNYFLTKRKAAEQSGLLDDSGSLDEGDTANTTYDSKDSNFDQDQCKDNSGYHGDQDKSLSTDDSEGVSEKSETKIADEDTNIDQAKTENTSGNKECDGSDDELPDLDVEMPHTVKETPDTVDDMAGEAREAPEIDMETG